MMDGWMDRAAFLIFILSSSKVPRRFLVASDNDRERQRGQGAWSLHLNSATAMLLLLLYLLSLFIYYFGYQNLKQV